MQRGELRAYLILPTDQMTQMTLDFHASVWFDWHIGEEGKEKRWGPICLLEKFSVYAQVLEQRSDIISTVFLEDACDASTPLFCGSRLLASYHRKGTARHLIKILSKQN